MPFNPMSSAVYKIKRYLISLLLIVLILPATASAGLGLLKSDKLQQSANPEGFSRNAGFADAGNQSLPTAVAIVINIFIGLLGTIFLILIVASGWNWFTAQGDADKVKKAKERMINATIGLVIIVSAYAVTVFVFRSTDELQLMNGGTEVVN